jgi:hypothetical protein
VRQSGSTMLSPGSNTATVRRSWRLRALSMLLARVRADALAQRS